MRRGNRLIARVFSPGFEDQETGMQEPRSFAYSLSQSEDGWAWSVYDEDGMTVARGADASRDRAEKAVERALRRGSFETSREALA